MGLLWGQFWVIRGTLEPYVSHFDVEILKMAPVMAICGGLVGPKSENVEKALVLPLLFEGSRAPRGRQSREQRSGPGGFEVQKMRFLIKDAWCLY